MRESRGLWTTGIERLNEGIYHSLTRLILAAALSLAAGPGCGTADHPTDDVGDEAVHHTLDWNAADPAAPTTRSAQLGQDLERFIERSDQIVAGEILAIDYATSEDLGSDTLSFPHTFVTVRVDDAIKGGQPGDVVTLRFGGGPVGDGRILTGSDVPLFGVDDQVVLFVAGNGEQACPLVDCSAGLVRMSDGVAYDAHGTELFVDEAGELREGVVREIPEATEFFIGDDALRLEREVRPQPSASQAMPASGFVDWLDARVGEQFAPVELAAMPSITSEDPAVPFVIQHPRPVAPRMAEAAPRTMGDADLAELDALRANDHNPVLPR